MTTSGRAGAGNEPIKSSSDWKDDGLVSISRTGTGKAKNHKIVLWLAGHLVLPPLVLWLLNGMRKSFLKPLEGVGVLLAGSVLV